MSDDAPTPEAQLDDAQRALAELRSIIGDSATEVGCHTFLALRNGRTKADRWRRIQFGRGLATKFKSGMFTELHDRLPAPDALTLFGFEDPPATHATVIAKADFPEVANWVDEVPTPDWPHTFGSDRGVMENARFHVACFHFGGEHGVLRVFQQRAPVSLMRRNSLLAVLATGRNELEEVEQQVFGFPLGADFVDWQGFVFVMRLPAFEALTNIRKVTLARAREAFDGIAAVNDLTVHGLVAVGAALQSKPLLAKKLAAAGRNGTLGVLQSDALADRIDTLHLPLQFKRKDGRVEITLDPDNPASMRAFVDLVADVYLRSPVTNLDYKAHSKELASPRGRR